jgi:hypothetical protein
MEQMVIGLAHTAINVWLDTMDLHAPLNVRQRLIAQIMELVLQMALVLVLPMMKRVTGKVPYVQLAVMVSMEAIVPIEFHLPLHLQEQMTKSLVNL